MAPKSKPKTCATVTKKKIGTIEINLYLILSKNLIHNNPTAKVKNIFKYKLEKLGLNKSEAGNCEIKASTNNLVKYFPKFLV